MRIKYTVVVTAFRAAAFGFALVGLMIGSVPAFVEAEPVGRPAPAVGPAPWSVGEDHSLGAAPSGAERRSGKNLTYRQAKIARGMASGIPLRDIMLAFFKHGDKIHDIVADAIIAGIQPATVVYTAIAEGYSADAVVSAAVWAGAPVNTVVSAAVDAGANALSISKAAAIAGAHTGASPGEVADAVAQATSPAAPVFGYTSPADSGPSVYTPSTPVVVGGGGGAPPSTLAASPVQPNGSRR